MRVNIQQYHVIVIGKLLRFCSYHLSICLDLSLLHSFQGIAMSFVFFCATILNSFTLWGILSILICKTYVGNLLLFNVNLPLCNHDLTLDSCSYLQTFAFSLPVSANIIITHYYNLFFHHRGNLFCNICSFTSVLNLASLYYVGIQGIFIKLFHH